MNCFYLIDKPLNITSFDVIRKLRKLLNIKKIGHTGTLDPLATGCLLIAVGDYTKLISYLEKDTKQYDFTVRLNGVSDSYDLGTEVRFLSEDKQKSFKNTLEESVIKDILKEKFTGKIKQVPPKYSAIKMGGKKALEKVRNGEDFEMKQREANIYCIEVLDFNYPELKLTSKVSAGTYIRSIASDLGDILGTGGYVSELRRTKIGDLDLSLTSSLEDFEQENILSIEKLFSSESFITLEEDVLSKINNGLKVYKTFDFKLGENLFVKKDNIITNIVLYESESLKAVRKI